MPHMSLLRKTIRRWVERISGREFERFGARSFAVFDKNNSNDAWFSYRTQLRDIIRRCAIDLIIDVGANEGQFGRMMRTFYGGELLSFEPVSAVYDKLTAHTRADSKWRAQKLALGSAESTLTMNISGHSVYSSLLRANEFCEQRFGGESVASSTETVAVRRLDVVLQELIPDISARRIFLKLDTQGYDLEVFKGLGDMSRLILAMQSEVSLIPIYAGMPHWTESVSTYEQQGFGVVGLFPVSRESSGRVIEYDCLMTRTKSKD
jgi:FkbM family methyltransferase